MPLGWGHTKRYHTHARQKDKRAHNQSLHFHHPNTHKFSLEGSRSIERNQALCVAAARTIGAILAGAREPLVRLPAAGEGLGRQRRRRQMQFRSQAACTAAAGRRATKPRSDGRGRHLASGGRIRAQVINAMLWPSSTINALSQSYFYSHRQRGVIKWLLWRCLELRRSRRPSIELL